VDVAVMFTVQVAKLLLHFVPGHHDASG